MDFFKFFLMFFFAFCRFLSRIFLGILKVLIKLKILFAALAVRKDGYYDEIENRV